MKGKINEADGDGCNSSGNGHLADIIGNHLGRRGFIKAGLGVTGGSLLLAACGGGDSAVASPESTPTAGSAATAQPRFSFKSVAINGNDVVTVPEGYSTQVVYAWGDPINGVSPVFRQDASNSATEQALQCGMHNDGMHFFPLPKGGTSSVNGLLCVNHEYTDDGLLHTDGITAINWTADKVQKAQNAHGVSVVEIALVGSTWRVISSSYSRRITASTPCAIAGPAAGDDLLKTAADNAGTMVLGTLNNCAHGYTPWGTYLTCEENWNGYFVNAAATIPAEQQRYGISKDGAGYRWHEFDTRFDAQANPNEPNRFGWVVEIDPFDPASQPVKRTALGRFKHEGAISTLARDNRVVVYMGDDERNEYIYKFVSSARYDTANTAAAKNLLDAGTLYVARFNADGSGTWLPLVFGQNGLTATNGFANQAEVQIKTRQAADRVGATMMDRPEWIAVSPLNKDVYVTLTNNNRRGTTPESANKSDGTTTAGSARPPVDAGNPRKDNTFGHILRWSEDGSDPAAVTFKWSVFVMAGDPASTDANKRGNIQGDFFGSPDGLWFDDRGILWVQTDISTSTLGAGDYKNIPNNMMLAADPGTGDIRRFLVGPKGCEVTGVIMTPDRKNMFINIQHPGETPSERSDPASPKAISAWPGGSASGRPRSATVCIRRNDGGEIGA